MGAHHFLSTGNRFYNGTTWRKIPLFSHLHPAFAVPLFVLACCDWKRGGLQGLLNTLKIDSMPYSVKEYSQSEILGDNIWRDLDIKKLSADYYSKQKNSKQALNFAPRFRIIITNEQI